MFYIHSIRKEWIPVLKETKYASKAGESRRHGGSVKYILVADQCVFSGISSPETAPTTVNVAESVILAIAEAEKINPSQTTFYDLHTHLSFPHLKPGETEFKKLSIAMTPQGKPRVYSWVHWECPPEVLEIFGPLLTSH